MAPVGAVIVAENRSGFWGPLAYRKGDTREVGMGYMRSWQLLAYAEIAAAADQIKVIEGKNFDTFFFFYSFGNSVQFERLDVHGVLFRSMLVWFPGTLTGMHGPKLEASTRLAKSP